MLVKELYSGLKEENPDWDKSEIFKEVQSAFAACLQNLTRLQISARWKTHEKNPKRAGNGEPSKRSVGLPTQLSPAAEASD
jgi:hypothetical protein